MDGREKRPGRDEHSDYFRKYVDLVADGDVLAALANHGRTLTARLRALPPERGAFRYAAGKWTVGEVLGHLIDTERVFAWGLASNAGARALPDLVAEFEAVRASTVALLRGLPPDAWDRRGTSSGVPITVRALAWITAGHGIHHDGVLVRAYGLPD